MSGTQLPLTVEDITAEWLTTALSSFGTANVIVEQVHTTDIVWGSATKVLLEATYSAGSSKLPHRLCVKGGFSPELRPIMAAGYQAEARFYRDVAPKLGEGLATCCFAAEDVENDQGIVILEDLAAAGAQFCDPRHPLSADNVAAGLEVLARWHRRTDIDAVWLTTPPVIRPAVRGLLSPARWAGILDQSLSDPVREVVGDPERLLKALEAIWTLEDERPARLVHGDANLTNLYFDGVGAPHFLDWQFACLRDVYRDVALFLIGSLTAEDRRAHEEALLRGYLENRGATGESFDDAWALYRKHAMHGVMYAVIPDEMQPTDIRMAFAERFAQAVVDHASFELLGAS